MACARPDGPDAALPRPRRGARARALAHLPGGPAAARAIRPSCTRRSSPGRSPGPASTPGSRSSSTPRSRVIGDGTTVLDTPTRHRPARSAPPSPPTCSPVLLRRNRLATVPVYDYVLMTEPLSACAARVDRLGGTAGHRRLGQPVPLLPADRRQPHPVRRLRRDLPLRRPRARERTRTVRRRSAAWPGTSSRPSRSWRASRFTHRWAGAIDTCSRFCAFFGSARRRPGRVRGRLHRARRGGDALRREGDARSAGRAQRPSAPNSRWCGRRPLPFPPEPAASIGINLTRWSLDRADHADGTTQRCFSRTLDAVGLGFDS